MSMNMADLYGVGSDAWSTLQPTSVSGPTQGSVAPPTRSAPGGSATAGGIIAISWLGLALLLIAWRLVVEYAK
jgi:hypothetical protein